MQTASDRPAPTPLSGPVRPAQARAGRLWRALAFALGLALAGAGVARPVAADPSDPAAQAALLYHNYCSVCHGDKGDGRSRASGALSTVPRDFTSAASRRELTRERIALAITHGRPGTAMVGWTAQLSAHDIDALTDHVLTRFVQPERAAAAAPAPISGRHAHGGRQVDAGAAPERPAALPARADSAAPVDMTLRLPGGRQGNLKRGAAFYSANCAACHGVGGDGAGPRAYFINPKPRNFRDAASRARLNRPALLRSVAEGRLGTDMPAWDKVATPQQIADVSEYVFQAFIAPAAAAPPR